MADETGVGGGGSAGPEGGQKAGAGDRPEAPEADWRLAGEVNQRQLRLLRVSWGRTYAVNFDGTEWTASPRDAPGDVLTHRDPEHLGTLISLDYARRGLRAGRAKRDDAWYREGFSSST